MEASRADEALAVALSGGEGAASGIVVPSDFGGRLWFSGKEIMEFLDSKKLPPKGVKENRRNESTFKSKQLSQKD
jgi:hypothetical protein